MIDSATELAVRRALTRIGVSLDGSLQEGTTAVVTRGTHRQTYVVAHDPALTAHLIETSADQGERRLVLADHILPRVAASLRTSDANFIDAAGNAYLTFGDTYIDIRGRRRLPTSSRIQDAKRSPDQGQQPTRQRRDSAANLFSAGRAQVSFSLLSWPWLLSDSLRAISETAGVSVAAVHRALDLLAQAGYITAGTQRHWIRPSELLDAWLAAYPVGLGATLRIVEFRGDPDRVAKPRDGDQIFASGESSFNPDIVRNSDTIAPLIHPKTLTLYVTKYDPELALLNRWRREYPANIYIRRKFWESPNGIDQPLGGIRQVPLLLIVADLLSGGEPRQREIAQQLKLDLDAQLRQM